MTEKYYQLGTYNNEQWCELHNELNQDGIGTISRCVSCADDIAHSPTRGVYLLTDEEAELLKQDPRVKFINLDYKKYPEQFKPEPGQLSESKFFPKKFNRYGQTVKHYRNTGGEDNLPDPTTSADLGRASYGLLRQAYEVDPWTNNRSAIIQSDVEQWGSGKNVDVVVCDEGCWFGHPEFQNNTNAPVPYDYVGGNLLPGNGYCDLLDVVTDGPYYIDPEWFDADSLTRLIIRWDGTIVPTETAALDWWRDSTKRSAKFSTIGTVNVPLTYTRNNVQGSNQSRPASYFGGREGTHGTPCSALTYGRTHGWAYNANKWIIDFYGVYGSGIEEGFDVLKLFHLHKPINPTYNDKNPTISSHSWGYRSNKDPGGSTYYYHFRGEGPTAYTSEPFFLNQLGYWGDGGRWSGEMIENSLTAAAGECVESGVIMIGSAGNSNQKQVSSDHPDFNNYIATNNTDALEDTSFIEIGLPVYGTVNRRGFPKQSGMYEENGQRIYPVISVGALDDDTQNLLEAKVTYSNMGNTIDVYGPGDETLAANNAYTDTAPHPATYPNYLGDAAEGAEPTVPLRSSLSGVYTSTELLKTFNPAQGTTHKIVTGADNSVDITRIEYLPVIPTANQSTTPDAGVGSESLFNGAWIVPVPWDIEYLGTTYSNVYWTIGSYLTFGTPTFTELFLDEDNPSIPKIFVSAVEAAAESITHNTYGTAPNRKFVFNIVHHNTNSRGTPNMQTEYHFYENEPSRIDIVSIENSLLSFGFGAPTTATDTLFGGTSAACPVVCGKIATILEHNRAWTFQDIRNHIQSYDPPGEDTFSYGRESVTPTDINFLLDPNSLEGGTPYILYNKRPPWSNARTSSTSGNFTLTGSITKGYKK